MHGEEITYGYGFWSLVALNAAIFIVFVLSFLTPVKRREWSPGADVHAADRPRP